MVCSLSPFCTRLFLTFPKDFPWSLRNIVPFWSGADYHDFHHMSFTNNYSTSFRWWDRIFGTDDKYRAYKQRKKLQGGGALVEKQLLEEVEREGERTEREVEARAHGGHKVH
jgi:methylsterol monooxygenase